MLAHLAEGWAIAFYRKAIDRCAEDDDQKMTPQLATDSEFFHRAFANPCTM
jgi:hypothetical protein